jgi:hypothetical protein
MSQAAIDQFDLVGRHEVCARRRPRRQEAGGRVGVGGLVSSNDLAMVSISGVQPP